MYKKIVCICLSGLLLLSACGKSTKNDNDNTPKVEAKIENCELEKYINNFDELIIKIQEEFNSTDLIIKDNQQSPYTNEKDISTFKHFGNGTWYLDVDGILVTVVCENNLALSIKYSDGRRYHHEFIDSSKDTNSTTNESIDIVMTDIDESILDTTDSKSQLTTWYIDDLSAEQIVDMCINLCNYEEPKDNETYDEFLNRVSFNEHLHKTYENMYEFYYNDYYDDYNSTKDQITYANLSIFYTREMDNSITKTNEPKCNVCMTIYEYNKAVEIYNALKLKCEQHGKVIEQKDDLTWGAGILIDDNYSYYLLNDLKYCCKAGVNLRNENGKYVIELVWTPIAKNKEEKEVDYNQGYIFSTSDKEEISEEAIKQLTDEELRYAINEIWARHGYIFRNQEILEYYRQFEWYVETVTADEWDKNGQNYYLNTIEQENIRKLTKERDSRS